MPSADATFFPGLPFPASLALRRNRRRGPSWRLAWFGAGGGLATEVVGVGRRAASLEQALSVGAVDRTTTELRDGVAQADLVVVCAPVGQIAQLVEQLAPHVATAP